MAATRPAVDQNQFHSFSPLDRLPPEHVEELLAYSRIERVPPGRRLFSRGDTDGETVFLLSGQLALVSDGPAGLLKASTREARHPVADRQPRHHTVIARTSATVLCVNSAVLNDLLRRGEAASAPPPPEPDPLPGVPSRPSAEAGRGIFDAPPFAGLPAAHLEVLKARMTRIAVSRGEVVVRQGEDCRYFHAIETGRFRAGSRRRRDEPGTGVVELLPGDSFGEDALIANEPFDVTVSALDDGSLLRISKGEFLTLVARHCVKWVPFRDLPALLADGAALLDVRSCKAYRRRCLPGSINFPLPLLHRAAFTLDRSRCYVVCGDSTRRSAAAAFLLARHGLKARILIEGVRAALRMR